MSVCNKKEAHGPPVRARPVRSFGFALYQTATSYGKHTSVAAIMDIGVLCSTVSQTALGCADISTLIICNSIKQFPIGNSRGVG